MVIVTHNVEYGADYSDTSFCGTCGSSCVLHTFNGCDSLYCSADYCAPKDEF